MTRACDTRGNASMETADANQPGRNHALTMSRVTQEKANGRAQDRGPIQTGSNRKEHPMSPQSKPSIVFCHGIWADGTCFSKLIPPLRADGHEVITAQYNLDTGQTDVDSVIRCLGRVSSPAILVGHSYGGAA